jgi:hypothetical protein
MRFPLLQEGRQERPSTNPGQADQGSHKETKAYQERGKHSLIFSATQVLGLIIISDT